MKSALIAELLERLATQLHSELKDRVEQIEFQADYPLRLESCIDLVESIRRNLSDLTGVTALQIEMDGQSEWLAVTNAQYVRAHLSDIHAKIIGEMDLRIVIDEQYAGCACLTHLG